jgi:hypothetical protein
VLSPGVTCYLHRRFRPSRTCCDPNLLSSEPEATQLEYPLIYTELTNGGHTDVSTRAVDLQPSLPHNVSPSTLRHPTCSNCGELVGSVGAFGHREDPPHLFTAADPSVLRIDAPYLQPSRLSEVEPSRLFGSGLHRTSSSCY